MKTFRCNVCENGCLIMINDDNRRPPRGCITGHECNATWLEGETPDEARNMVIVERVRRENEKLKHELQKVHEDRMHYMDKYINLHRWIKNFLALGESGMEAIWDAKKGTEE